MSALDDLLSEARTWPREGADGGLINALADALEATKNAPSLAEFVTHGVCLACGGGVLNSGEHIDFDRHVEYTQGVNNRLSWASNYLNRMSVLAGGSSAEPWVKLRLVSLTKLQEILDGETNPDEWVSERCGYRWGSHTPHHWSDYSEGRDPLRITRWCDGSDRPNTEREESRRDH